MSVEKHLDIAFRLKRAICAVSDTLPTHSKCIVDQFLRHVSPTFARSYGSEFPHTCRVHPKDAERCRDGSGNYPLLYFHVGNAVLAYYDTILGRVQPKMDDRIQLLEDIAVRGFHNFVRHGSDVDGFRLIDTDEARKLREAENAAELERFNKENAENEGNAVPAATESAN